jgi:exosome complex RNA-binding protein Rrp4
VLPIDYRSRLIPSYDKTIGSIIEFTHQNWTIVIDAIRIQMFADMAIYTLT